MAKGSNTSLVVAGVVGLLAVAAIALFLTRSEPALTTGSPAKETPKQAASGSGAAAPAGPATSTPKKNSDQAAAQNHVDRAGMGKFDATGMVPCAQNKGEPMGQCKFGVARGGGGSATVMITQPDGRTRAIFFEKGNPVGADTSQADGAAEFRSKKESDLYSIQVGNERYEITEAVIFGG